MSDTPERDLSDWDHRDPDAANVYYDLAAWTPDQRAVLIEALADADIPHGWEDDELVVPEELEAELDALFEVLEASLGIESDGDRGAAAASVAIPSDEPLTEYELDDWDLSDRAVLTEALVASRVPHRWEGDVLVVPTAAEEAVEELMTDIETGQVWIVPDDDSDDPDVDDIDPAAVLVAFRQVGERLSRDPLDPDGLDALRALLDESDPSRSLPGIAPASWRQVCALADELADAITGGAAPDEPLAVDAAERLAAVTSNLLS